MASLKKAYEEKGYINLYDVMCMNFNNGAKAEMEQFKYKTMKKIMPLVCDIIDSAKRESGRRYDYTKRDNMKLVIELLYSFLIESKRGQVSPSIMTLVYTLYPEVEKVEATDSAREIKRKEKVYHKMEMRVQRALKDLEAIGLIRVVKYYKDKAHMESYKSPCHYYIITPLSKFYPETFSVKGKTITPRKRSKAIRYTNQKKEKPVKKYIAASPKEQQPDLIVLEVHREFKAIQRRRENREWLERFKPHLYEQIIKEEQEQKRQKEEALLREKEEKTTLFKNAIAAMTKYTKPQLNLKLRLSI